MPHWSVDIIRARLEYLGVIVAKTEAEAIEEAIKKFGIEPAQRDRIKITKISDRDD